MGVVEIDETSLKIKFKEEAGEEYHGSLFENPKYMEQSKKLIKEAVDNGGTILEEEGRILVANTVVQVVHYIWCTKKRKFTRKNTFIARKVD